MIESLDPTTKPNLELMKLWNVGILYLGIPRINPLLKNLELVSSAYIQFGTYIGKV